MSKVLKRPMFMQPPVKKAAGGILSIVEDTEEPVDNYTDRSPDNPEIIANNLRGDMRSLDERYLELAQMVGEQAFETPEEVLVLMQAQLAQQGQQQGQQQAAPAPGPEGLAALGQGVPPGGAPGGMPPGAPGPMPPGMPQGEAPAMEAPGGIEALVAENEEVPQAPVNRSQGSGMMGEVAGMPNAYTGEDVSPGDQPLENELMQFVTGGGDLDTLAASAAQGIPEATALPLSENPMDYSDALGQSTPELGLAQAMSGAPTPKGAGQAAGLASLSSMLPSGRSSGSAGGAGLAAMASAGNKALLDAQRQAQARPRDPNNPLLSSIFTNLPQPVRRSRGSPMSGERVDPFLRIEDEINEPRRREARIPAWQRQLRAEGVLPEDGERAPKSRPLTPEELEERVRRRENQGPLTRRIYDFARRRGIDPNLLENRMKSLLSTPAAQRVMSAGSAVGRAAFNPLTAAGMLAADVGYKMAPSIAGVTTIPDEFRTEPGVLPGVNPLPVGQMALPDGSPSLADRIPPAVPEGGVTVGIPGLGAPEEPPPPTSRELVSETTPTSNVLDLGDINAEERYDPRANLNPQGSVLMPPTGERPSVEAAPDAEETAAGKEPALTPQEGESPRDFATRVRERAALYKELLGDSDAARKAQAYGILAEVGFRLAGAKGYSLGERLSKGMEGAGSAFAQMAANADAAERKSVAAAISSVEQEDRDAARYQKDFLLAQIRQQQAYDLAQFRAGTQLQVKQMEIANSQLPRKQRIDQRVQLIMADNERNRSLNPEIPSITLAGATRLATMQEDKTVTTDELGNIRDPSNQVLAYGPANQPTPEGGIGYVARDYPFLQTGGARPATAFTVEEMQKARDDRAGAQSLLSGLQRAKLNLEKVYGPMNLLTRAVTSVVQPIVGDIGPIDASNFGAANAIRQFQKDLRELLVLNPNRATKYELELMEPLMDNPNNLLKSSGIALANLLEIERTLINRINAADYRLNPNAQYKQIGSIPLGTKQQPLPANAFQYMGEHFKAVPGATIYYQRGDGRVVGLNKQQYDQMTRGQ